MSEEYIDRAVRMAILRGMSVEEFKQTAAEIWDVELVEKRERDAREWARGKS